MASRFIIYGLIDPRDGQLRYVGKTSRGLDVRFREHLRDVGRGVRRHVCWWIRSLVRQGLEPERFEIDVCGTEVDASVSEQFYISYFRSLGCRLTNDTAGGEGMAGYRHTPEARLKMSEARRGKPAPREAIERMVELTRGRPRSPDVRLKVSRARGGRGVIDEAGVVYLSVNDAATRLGLDRSNAAKALKKGYRIGGHVLRYVEELRNAA